MSPEYLEQLAEIADPDKLWRLNPIVQLDLSTEKRHQLDTAVALRRHASHQRQLDDLLMEQRSLLITPLSPNHIATMSVDTPENHEKLRPAHRMRRLRDVGMRDAD